MTSTTKHTPEPWVSSGTGDVSSREANGRSVALCDLAGNTGEAWQEDIANADRIVECVNACAGITDPAAIPQAVVALEGLLARFISLVNSGDCGFWDPETENEVRAARAALAALKNTKETPE